MAAALAILLYTIFRKRPAPKPGVLDRVNVKREDANRTLAEFNLPPFPESAKNIRVFFVELAGGQVYMKCKLSAEDGAAYMKEASKELAIPFDKNAMRALHRDELLDWWTPSRIKKGMMHERTWENKEKNMREGLYIYWDEENCILYLQRSWS